MNDCSKKKVIFMLFFPCWETIKIFKMKLGVSESKINIRFRSICYKTLFRTRGKSDSSSLQGNSWFDKGKKMRFSNKNKFIKCFVFFTITVSDQVSFWFLLVCHMATLKISDKLIILLRHVLNFLYKKYFKTY